METQSRPAINASPKLMVCLSGRMPEANIRDLWFELIPEIGFGPDETSPFAGIYVKLA